MKGKKKKNHQIGNQEMWGQGTTLPWAFSATEEVMQNLALFPHLYIESNNFILLIFKVFVKVDMEMTNM